MTYLKSSSQGNQQCQPAFQISAVLETHVEQSAPPAASEADSEENTVYLTHSRQTNFITASFSHIHNTSTQKHDLLGVAAAAEKSSIR